MRWGRINQILVRALQKDLLDSEYMCVLVSYVLPCLDIPYFFLFSRAEKPAIKEGVTIDFKANPIKGCFRNTPNSSS